jgi:hypothetical protein
MRVILKEKWFSVAPKIQRLVTHPSELGELRDGSGSPRKAGDRLVQI